MHCDRLLEPGLQVLHTRSASCFFLPVFTASEEIPLLFVRELGQRPAAVNGSPSGAMHTHGKSIVEGTA
jgi:hypothetical protein